MPDYKGMYLHLMRETEKAVRILVEAQQACEEQYLSGDVPSLYILPRNAAHNSSDLEHSMENPQT